MLRTLYKLTDDSEAAAYEVKVKTDFVALDPRRTYYLVEATPQDIIDWCARKIHSLTHHGRETEITLHSPSQYDLGPREDLFAALEPYEAATPYVAFEEVEDEDSAVWGTDKFTPAQLLFVYRRVRS